MSPIHITIPVYYTKTWKTKDQTKTWLLSLNWFRNSHHFEQNEVKAFMHQYLHPQLITIKPFTQQFRVIYHYYYKSKVSDLPNVGPLASKWLLDAMQELGIIKNDNVQYLVEEHYYATAHDPINPRIEATILLKEPINDDS